MRMLGKENDILERFTDELFEIWANNKINNWQRNDFKK